MENRRHPIDLSTSQWTPAEVAQAILDYMLVQTMDENRVWANAEWRSQIEGPAKLWPAFSSILADERTDWRNDDFADRVIAIRDRGEAKD